MIWFEHKADPDGPLYWTVKLKLILLARLIPIEQTRKLRVSYIFIYQILRTLRAPPLPRPPPAPAFPGPQTRARTGLAVRVVSKTKT